MNDGVHAMQGFLDRHSIAHIPLNQVNGETRDVRELQINVVGRIKIVEHRHRVTPLKQGSNQVRPDESRTPGDEDPQSSSLNCS